MMFSFGNNRLKQYDCDISRSRRRLIEIKNDINEKEQKKKEYGFSYYRDQEKRKEIIRSAEMYGFSREKINFMNRYIDDWNQDNVTLEVIDNFYMAEEFVKDNEEYYKKGLFYRLSKLLESGN